MDLQHWVDPDPWGPTADNSRKAVTKAAVERKMKFATVLDQGDESEFIIATQKRTMAPVLREPDRERCRRDWRGGWALRRLQRLPAASAEGSRKPEVSHLHPHCEIPGPFEQWKACCRVYRAAFMMLDIRTMATCVASRPTSRSSTGCMREHGT